jgi:hypothetical protein
MYIAVIDKGTAFAKPHSDLGVLSTPEEVAAAINERAATLGVNKDRYSIARMTFVEPVTKTVTTWEEI